MILNGSGTVNYNVDGTGECFGFNLFNNKEVAVQRSYAAKGTVFPDHLHKGAVEVLIYYRGKGKTIIDGKEEPYRSGIVAVIPSDTLHKVIVDEDTWIIGVTVPAEGGYPYG